jgi:hypothetical protein
MPYVEVRIGSCWQGGDNLQRMWEEGAISGGWERLLGRGWSADDDLPRKEE